MTVLQESILNKAKNFVINNKGKLAAAAALAGGAYAASHYDVGGINEKISGLFKHNDNQTPSTLKPEPKPTNGTAQTDSAPTTDHTSTTQTPSTPSTPKHDDTVSKIKQFESSNKHHFTPYKDNEGNWTIGNGINLNSLDASKRAELGIPANLRNPDEIANYLKQHPINGQIENNLTNTAVEQAKQDVSRLLGKPYDQIEPRVRKLLTDMDYNMGASRLAGFHNALAEYKAHGATPKFFDEIKDSKYYRDQLPKNHARYQYITSLINGNQES